MNNEQHLFDNCLLGWPRDTLSEASVRINDDIWGAECTLRKTIQNRIWAQILINVSGNLHTHLHCCTHTFILENTQIIMDRLDSPKCTSRPYDPSPSLGKSIDVQLIIFSMHIIIILNGSKHALRSSKNWKHVCGSWFLYAFLKKGKTTSEHYTDLIQ